MQLSGWIVWGLLAGLAIFLALGARISTKSGYNFTKAIAVQTFLLWLSLILFLFFDCNKLHLLWITPAIFIGVNLIGGIPIISHILFICTWIFMKIILIGCKKVTTKPTDFDF